jgi:hypothetical protein
LRLQNLSRVDDSTALLPQIPGGRPRAPRVQAEPQAAPQTDEEGLLDMAEMKVRGALKSLKGKLRDRLRGLSDSKWLTDKDHK